MPSTVLLDLDGTLLPMDQEKFTEVYFAALCEKMAPRGYDPKTLVAAIWKGTAAMVKNDGARSNEQVFWDFFAAEFGEEKVRLDRAVFEDFYANDFSVARPACGFQPLAAEAVRLLRAAGRRVVLASNPIFPGFAQRGRMEWAGLDPAEFSYVTAYENSRYCKPNPDYYREIARTLDVRPEDCLMVGNDAREDMAAATVGMRVFLVTDCLINSEKRDISVWPHGDFAQLMKFLRDLPA